MMENPIACPFCELPKWRILAETQNFIITTPLDPIVTDEILVIPRRHVRALTLLNQSEREEVDTIWNIILGSLKEYGCGLVFEHGNHYRGPFEPWHDHAHMHLLAVAFDISLTCAPFSKEQLMGDFSSFPPTTNEYIFCKDFKGKSTLFILSEPLPHKFLRLKCMDLIATDKEHAASITKQFVAQHINLIIKQLPSLLTSRK